MRLRSAATIGPAPFVLETAASTAPSPSPAPPRARSASGSARVQRPHQLRHSTAAPARSRSRTLYDRAAAPAGGLAAYRTADGYCRTRDYTGFGRLIAPGWLGNPAR